MNRECLYRKLAVSILGSALVGLAWLPAGAADKSVPAASPGWNAEAAAHYMDQREVWWEGWDHARRDHGTMCVSCHTQAPYALARPLLRPGTGQAPSQPEQAMLADVEKRVRGWKDMQPFYSDAGYGTGKEVESRNAEAVLNAVILSSYDQRQGQLRDVTKLAFDHAWALQSLGGPDAGAWVWQNFEYTPWESKESQYHWAALIARAAATAPDHYGKDGAVAANMTALRAYLQSHYDTQPLLNKVATLWASDAMRGLLTDAQRGALLAELEKRQRADGGWSLTDLGTWARRDKTPLETASDGYATGFIVLALEQGGAGPAQVQRGIAWLVAHQDKSTGAWPAWSLNKKRDPNSQVGQFMSDAATGYAVMALENRR